MLDAMQVYAPALGSALNSPDKLMAARSVWVGGTSAKLGGGPCRPS